MANRTGPGGAAEEEDDDPVVSFPELLRFCGRAQTLITELLLLADRVPSEFRDRRFDPVLFDLRYFDSPSDFESRIEGNAELEALEDQLRESCSNYMQRFFNLASGIVIYHMELLKYLNDLQEGLYVHYSLDSVLESKSGCQLLTESITLFACVLLLMEHRIVGILREKLLVAHLRYDRCFNLPKLEEICSLCRIHQPNTGTLSHTSASSLTSDILSIQKPEILFARFPFPKLVVDAIISCLRGDDMYNNIRHYPDPQHRTVALSLQDLFASWDAYKEAKAALSSCLSPNFIRDCCLYYSSKVTHLLSELGSSLSDGALKKDYVLDNSQHLISFIRNCNITLRWLLLHRISNDKRSRDIVTSIGLAQQVDDDSLLQLLLKASQLEFEVKFLYDELLRTREAMWCEKKRCASECMEDLSRNHFGTWASSHKFKNKSLKDWFDKLSLEQMQSLNYSGHGSSGRIIYRVISSIKDIEQLDQVEESLQIKHGLAKVQKSLHDMIKILNLDIDAMRVFSVVTDAVYAWGYIAKYDKLLKKKIKQDPSTMLILHALFLKFQSFLNVPLQWIEQCQSEDLPYVSRYYSSEYAARIFTILEIVPVVLLDIFNDNLQAQHPFHLVNRIDKDAFEDFMQLDTQLKLARQAGKLSVISEGIMIMSRNLNGLINSDLRNWLEENVRKELSRRLESKLQSHFLPHAGRDDLETNLVSLSTFILSQLRMMETLQDVLHIHGSHIWEETFTELLNRCAQKEQTEIVRRKQESKISVAKLNDFSKSTTFFGHLLHQMFQLTDPSRSMYIEPMVGWFDAEGRELLGLHFFNLLESSVGQVGLAILDSLLALLIKENLELTLKSFHVLLDSRCMEELHKLDKFMGPPTSIPLLGLSLYNQMVKMFNVSWEPLAELLATIGRLQLLRCLVSFKLRSSSKIKADLVTSATENLISSVSLQRERILECLKDEEEKDSTVRNFLHSLFEQQRLCGLQSPLRSVYMSEDPPTCLSRFTSVFSISQLSRYVLDVHLGTLTSKLKKSSVDFSPLVIGLGTFLRQFHAFYITQYAQFMGQYIRIAVATASDSGSETQKGSGDYASEVLKSAFWLMFFGKYMEIPKELIESCFPSSVLAILQT
ncbi:WASH complex subunit strumpellin homolog isoform X3 [Ananas comosus]|uniref:WASH complex subunit strumpellin homolog isoform X3 n=1 Tax=Ananas comosus TaxID=4615 RepID=A0A6P5GUN0_ANACO|nr:WASH complex subunit strumpellin homolog isoform X3 [Ananas comosus]